MDLESIISALAVACVVYFLVQRLTKYLNDRKEARQLAKTLSLVEEDEKGADLNDGICIRILFGTQTGTAEKLAKELRAKIIDVYGQETLKVVVEDIENYRYAEKLHLETYVFFCAATYGDGEPTDSAVDFDQWLTEVEEVGEDLFNGVKFGVMALGNREYEHFCIFGKKIDRVMAALGGNRIAERIDGDDSKCIEDDFENFAKNALDGLDKEEALQNLASEAVHQTLTSANVPAYDVTLDPAGPAVARTSSHMSHVATVSQIRELHSERSDRSCLHVELDISMSGVEYECGDHVAILPENCTEIVNEAAECLGLSLDTVFSLSLPEGNPEELPPPFTGPISLRAALMKYADLTNPPQKLSLKLLSAFATDPKESEKLLFLSSSEGREKFTQMVHNNAMSLLELMQAFPSAKPSLGAFFGSICPRIQPRYYSISSSPLHDPNHIHVTAAVVHEKKPTGKIHKGVCTNWLSIQELGAIAPMHVRKSHFKLPMDPMVPIIMVGPGTGLAPFRGFLQERAKLSSRGVTLGPALLFFGCRNREIDYIYQEELEGYVNDGTLTALHCAFSRELDHKVYVQHKLLENKEEVWSLLSERSGYFYLCGEASRMAKDVHRTLHEIAEKVSGESGSKVEQMIKSLNDQGRYQKDIW